MHTLKVTIAQIESHPLSRPVIFGLDRAKTFKLLAMLNLDFPTILDRSWTLLRLFGKILIILHHVLKYFIRLVSRMLLQQLRRLVVQELSHMNQIFKVQLLVIVGNSSRLYVLRSFLSVVLWKFLNTHFLAKA